MIILIFKLPFPNGTLLMPRNFEISGGLIGTRGTWRMNF